MTVSQTTRRYTPGEYYELERSATYKSDYYRGEIFAMAGGSIRHSAICTNILAELRNRLKGSSCRPYESNLRLKNKFSGLRNYPDVSVYCAPFEFDDEDSSHETVTNPSMVFEVLSPSTEAYDRGLKSENYRRIESMKAYALVSQDNPHVEILERRPDGSWALNEVRGLTSVLVVNALQIELPLAEIYDGVDFPPDVG